MLENRANQSDEINTISFNFNEKDIAKVCFYSMDEIILYENQYPFNNCIGDVIKDFLTKQNSKEKSSLSFYIKNNDLQFNLIDEQKLLSYYITNLQDTLFLMEQGFANNSVVATSICSNKFLKIYVKKVKSLNTPDNIEHHIINNTQYIGKPALNKLGYYVYNKEKKELKNIELSQEQIDIIGINYFSRKTSYCNAENYLYIFEGKFDYSNNNYIFNYDNKFISINLINNEINLISSAFPQRILHSMIFIPENYIFIIGGKYSKEVLVYKINEDNRNYEKYPHLLPFELYEPSLILIDNKYLYAFENSRFSFQILRTNFIFQSPFEEIKFVNYNNLIINQKFFGVVKQNNSILFLGGQIINEKQLSSTNSFEFNYISEVVKKDKRKFTPLDFSEKTFIPLGNDEYIQISENLNKNDYIPTIIIFQGNSKKSDKSSNTNSNDTQKYFESINTKENNINLPDNTINIINSSTNGEMFIPFNNYENK